MYEFTNSLIISDEGDDGLKDVGCSDDVPLDVVVGKEKCQLSSRVEQSTGMCLTYVVVGKEKCQLSSKVEQSTGMCLTNLGITSYAHGQGSIGRGHEVLVGYPGQNSLKAGQRTLVPSVCVYTKLSTYSKQYLMGELVCTQSFVPPLHHFCLVPPKCY